MGIRRTEFGANDAERALNIIDLYHPARMYGLQKIDFLPLGSEIALSSRDLANITTIREQIVELANKGHISGEELATIAAREVWAFYRLRRLIHTKRVLVKTPTEIIENHFDSSYEFFSRLYDVGVLDFEQVEMLLEAGKVPEKYLIPLAVAKEALKTSFAVKLAEKDGDPPALTERIQSGGILRKVNKYRETRRARQTIQQSLPSIFPETDFEKGLAKKDFFGRCDEVVNSVFPFTGGAPKAPSFTREKVSEVLFAIEQVRKSGGNLAWWERMFANLAFYHNSYREEKGIEFDPFVDKARYSSWDYWKVIRSTYTARNERLRTRENARLQRRAWTAAVVALSVVFGILQVDRAFAGSLIISAINLFPKQAPAEIKSAFPIDVIRNPTEPIGQDYLLSLPGGSDPDSPAVISAGGKRIKVEKTFIAFNVAQERRGLPIRFKLSDQTEIVSIPSLPGFYRTNENNPSFFRLVRNDGRTTIVEINPEYEPGTVEILSKSLN